MKRLALAAVAVIALAGLQTATAAQTPTHAHATRPDPCAHHRHPGAEQRQLAEQVFAYRNWRSPAPGYGALKTMRRLRGCVDGKTRRSMAAAWKAKKADLHLQRRYRLVAPEPGFSGEGRFLRWLPIPRYIVECETNGYAGDGRWLVTNPDGDAQGPAQLKAEWGAPRPATSAVERVGYWEITRMIWTNYGAGKWACA